MASLVTLSCPHCKRSHTAATFYLARCAVDRCFDEKQAAFEREIRGAREAGLLDPLPDGDVTPPADAADGCLGTSPSDVSRLNLQNPCCESSCSRGEL